MSGSTDETWRVYLTEWVTVYTSDASGPEGADECWGHFESKYKGRVRDEDRQVVATDHTKPGAYPYSLELRLPNLKGELKDEADGLVHVAELTNVKPWRSGETHFLHTVRRGSAEEQELLDYGRKMLPETI